MQNSLIEALIQVATFLLYGVAATVLAGIGALFEYRSYSFLSGGETVVAVWIGALGLILLALAYLVVRDKAVTAFTDIRTA